MMVAIVILGILIVVGLVIVEVRTSKMKLLRFEETGRRYGCELVVQHMPGYVTIMFGRKPAIQTYRGAGSRWWMVPQMTHCKRRKSQKLLRMWHAVKSGYENIEI